MPKFNLKLSQDPKEVLSSMNFDLKSMKFGSKTVDRYNPIYDNEYKKGWKQLEIGEHDSNANANTIYCGGSVAAVDWAPVSGGLNFLVVACNNGHEGVKLNLTESSKSCLQVYEIKGLDNDKK